MKEKTLTRKRKGNYPPAPYQSFPELIATCPKCGAPIELWSEDEVTACIFCGQKLFERERTTH